MPTQPRPCQSVHVHINLSSTWTRTKFKTADQISLCVCVCVSLACQHGLPDCVCVCVEQTPSARWGFAPSRAAMRAITAVVIARFDSLLVYWYFFFFYQLFSTLYWYELAYWYFLFLPASLVPSPFLHARFRYVIAFVNFFFCNPLWLDPLINRLVYDRTTPFPLQVM